MMKPKFKILILCIALVLSACGSSNTKDELNVNDEKLPEFQLNELTGSTFIADYSVAKEEKLRAIPEKYINLARQNLHVAYQHTSHGTHVSYGMYGLQDYKPGDKELFGITRNEAQSDKLDFQDYVIEKYAEGDDDASDLSRNESAFIQATRNYLDDPDNSKINVVMWAWCSIRNHDLEGVYFPGMQTLFDEYGVGGSKIGEGDGQRAKPVYFVFMTGHASDSGNLDDGDPGPQAKIVTDFCSQNKFLCLDYYSIDTHCMNDNYWDDAGDDSNSYKYNNSTSEEGYFYHDWQNAHTLGEHYFENKRSPNGKVDFGQHTTQHITSNRKAYAMWWILARISGWDGESQE